MQNTYQEKRSYPMNQDFILGKKLEGGIKLSTVTDFKPAGDQPEAIKKPISKKGSKSEFGPPKKRRIAGSVEVEICADGDTIIID